MTTPVTTRRQMIATAASAALLSLRPAAAETATLRNMGGAPAGFPMHNRGARDSGKPFDFMEYCHSLGFGAMETRLPSTDADAIKKFRQRLDSWNMRVMMDIPLPRTAADAATFDTAVKAAKDAGAVSLHTAMTARRYEQFDAFDAFKKDFERCQATIMLAEPVLRKHQMRLGIENHKGWRSGEQAAWLKRVSSEWVGVHFDFGNNVSLCEDPSETLANLRPYIFACHIKDMAVEPYEDGFLLSEVPLGDGFLDLKSMVAAIQKRDPKTPFDLEMITRDPLKIPVFTSKYWVTFDDSYSPLPGRDLARVLDIVRKNKPKSPLPRTTGMSAEAQLKLEDENVGKSIAWARQNLSL
ncbi:MAG TPA: sugar phosphate isomerase/epimerase family protein [Candidatus Solibacter sp.]|nr:sugar phosphate isomerase/epimerase family protein [Candidatus Solibacter sp.]